MKNLNETSSANVNVLAEGELDQVVGGYCSRKRWGRCRGWHKPRYNHCKRYEHKEPEYQEESSEYESNDYSEPADTGNVQIANVAVTVNIAQVQG